MAIKTLYTTLGVDPTADADDIDNAFNRLRGCDFFNFSSWHLSTEVIHSTAE